MFNIKIENNKKDDYILKVGDIVISEFNELCFIVETRNPKTHSVVYAIQNARYSYANIANATAVSLEMLTNHAKLHNYKIFSQDEYDLILRHKDIGAVG